ncbi:MAG: TraR/DksA family transcriptional regulator [Planctomycetaceae bacterium]
MTKDNAKVRERLEAMLATLVARAERIDSDLSQPTDEDWEERATELQDDDVLSSVGNLTVSEIEQIKRALRRIDEGTYGACERCGATIPPERHALLPYATTCTGCA